MHIRRRILTALICAAGANALPTNASLVSPGTYTFNIDMTASIPYSLALLTVQGVLDPGESVSTQLFTDLNGTGSTTGTLSTVAGNSRAPFGPNIAGSNETGVLDGVYSIQLVIGGGNVDIDLLNTFVRNAAGGTIATQTLIPGAAAVAEPATLALIGLGLSSLALTRRRRAN